MIFIKQQLNIIASIPYIGEKYAERLLKNFKTIKNIINASPQEISSKAKIPYKTSIKIWRILNEEYKRWNMFSYLRKILCLIMLLICSYKDIKTREVDDRIWLIFSPIGIIITLFEFFLKFIDFSYLILYFISILITIIVSIIIYYSKFVGGADSKSLISISFLDLINLNKNTIHPFTSIIILTNSCIISLIIPYLLDIKLRILKKDLQFQLRKI